MNRLAINIVLIPPNLIQNDIIELNTTLISTKDSFALNKIDRVPHLTLLMWGIDESSLGELITKLAIIKKDFQHKIVIESVWVETSILPDNQEWQYINIKSITELTILYNKVISNLKPLLWYTIDKEIFVGPNEINNLTVDWVMWHANKRLLEEFQPHISIWIGWMERKIPYTKKSSGWKLWIYQLWNYCTCRKELFSIKL